MHLRYALALSLLLPLSSQAQTTIFSDTFNNGSTVNTAPSGSPTANSTAYQIGTGVNTATASISAGHLQFSTPSTTGDLIEYQALFAGSPVTLGTIGDYIGLTVTFVNTAGILNGSASSTLNAGMYNSGGSQPQTGMITFNSTTSPTGGAQNWVGYGSRIFQSGNANIFTRPKQTSVTSAQNQELLFTGASGSQAFNSPSGTGLGNTVSAVTMADGNTYTLDFRITLSGASTLTISNSVYSGSDTSGSLLFAQIKNATAGNFLTNSFDGMAVGWRYTPAVGAVSTIDINSITVVSQIAPVPEPGVWMLTVVGIATLVGVRRFRRS